MPRITNNGGTNLSIHESHAQDMPGTRYAEHCCYQDILPLPGTNVPQHCQDLVLLVLFLVFHLLLLLTGHHVVSLGLILVLSVNCCPAWLILFPRVTILICGSSPSLNIIFGGQGAHLVSLFINFSFLKKDHKTYQSTTDQSFPLGVKMGAISIYVI